MAIGTVSAVMGVGMGLAQAIGGARQARKAREALENYQRQRLTNVADELSVYTKGAELQREESARMGASAVDALQEGGARNLIGGLGQLQQNQQLMNRQIGADLEGQQARIDAVRAQDSARIQGMQEQREQQDINALSSQFNAGQQQMWQGIGGVAQAGISGMQMNQEVADQRNYMSWFGGGGASQGVMDNTRNINVDFLGRGTNPMFQAGGFGYNTGATNRFDSNSRIG